MANKRVLRNISDFTATPNGGSPVTPDSIMEISLNDSTGELKTGSDNDSAYKKFNNPYEFNGTMRFEDPIEAAKLKGKNNCTGSFKCKDINGVGDALCSFTGARFTQPGIGTQYGQQGVPTLNVSGGEITFTAV